MCRRVACLRSTLKRFALTTAETDFVSEKIINPFVFKIIRLFVQFSKRPNFRMTLSALLDQLQSQKDNVLFEIESWSLESINYRPSPREWSAIEVLDHLVRTEVAILAAARRGLLKPHRIGIIDALRTRFIQTVFPLRSKSESSCNNNSSATGLEPGAAGTY